MILQKNGQDISNPARFFASQIFKESLKRVEFFKYY